MSAFISDYIHIKKHGIWLNGKLWLANNDSIEKFSKAAYMHLEINYPKFYKMDTMSKLGILASEILFSQNSKVYPSFARGMFFQNASSSLASDKKFQVSIETLASPALFVYTLPNIVMGEIAIRHQLKGENTFFISASFDAKSIADYTQIVFSKKILSQAIVGFLESYDDEIDVFLCLIEDQGTLPANEFNFNNLYKSISSAKSEYE